MSRFAVVTIIILCSLNCTAITIYVSPNGSDKNLGTKHAPVKTLQQARDMLRKHNIDPKKQILLYAGHYQLTESFELSKQDSGTAKSPLTIKPVSIDDKVYISGGIIIPIDRAKKITDSAIANRLLADVRDKVYCIDLQPFNLSLLGIFGLRGFAHPYIPAPNELFIDAEPQHIAQWPNPEEPAIHIGKLIDPGSNPRRDATKIPPRGAIFAWNCDRPKRWTQAKDVYISGLFNHGFADDNIPLKEIDQKNKLFKTKYPHLYGFTNKNPWNTWRAINLLEEIDISREYFVDRQNQKLYFYPNKPISKIKIIQLSVLPTPLFVLNDVSHVQIQNITFENTRSIGIYIERGEHCIITDCEMRNIGEVAICIGQGSVATKQLAITSKGKVISKRIGSLYAKLYSHTTLNRQGGKNHIIMNCHIHATGAGAIIMGGGDRKTLTPANNRVYNCRIHNFNRLDRTYKTAVNIDGVGNKIQHCLIYDAPGTAILLHGNDHIIEYNEIHNVMLSGDDQGAYYLGRDPSEFNNIVRYNYFHHIGQSKTAHKTWAVYYDDGSCGNKAYGNIFYKAGKKGTFLVGGGNYNKISNNIFIESNLAIQIDNRCQTWATCLVSDNGIFRHRLNKVKFDQPPYSIRYPELAKYWQENPEEPKNIVEKNIFYKCKKLINSNFKTTIWKNNFQTEQDPGFVNINKNNFQLKKDAKIYKIIKKFQQLPFKKMGLISPN